MKRIERAIIKTKNKVLVSVDVRNSSFTGRCVTVVYVMPGAHRTSVTILCVHVAFWMYALESDTVRYITVVKGVERCRTLREIGHGLKSKFLKNFTFSPVESEFAERFVNRAKPF